MSMCVFSNFIYIRVVRMSLQLLLDIAKVVTILLTPTPNDKKITCGK